MGSCGRWVALGDEVTIEVDNWKINIYIFGKKIKTYDNDTLFQEFQTNNVAIYPAISIWGKGESMQLIGFETEQ